MKRAVFWCSVLVLAGISLWASTPITSSPQQVIEARRVPSRETIFPAPAFTPDELTALPTDGWPTNGGSLYSQRYSPLDQINRDNINDLKAVWRVHLESGLGPKYSGEAQPLVYKGVIYIITGDDEVSAIGVKSGRILWKYQANLDPEISTVCCGWTSRGVGLGDGKVFVGQLDGSLVALDQRTGQPIWRTPVGHWQDGITITSAPLFYNGMVITGFSGAEYGLRGRVTAYDAKDGKEIWRFYTIPGPGEVGHETWPQDSEVWKHGGAVVWQTPAVDPELGLLYFSTANPGPDFNGAVRAGDNLFSVSIVVIETQTGKYRWHFQQVHHDLWDYDSPSPVMLFDLEIDGAMRKAAAEAGKTGWVYILDRETGEPLIGIEEKPVPQEPRQATSPTQPYPVGDAIVPQSLDIAPEGHILVNQGRIFTPYWTDGTVSTPSSFGGVNWPPSSYDPASNYYYACANNRIGLFIGGDKDEELPEPGARYLGGDFSGVPIPTTGIFAALDMKTNRLVWRQRWKDYCYSGSVVTAGGLVFVGRSDGRFMALDSATGEHLWEFQTDAGVNAPASVFEQDGEQYVVVFSAGNQFGRGPRGDSVWLFSLKGTLGPTDPPDMTAEIRGATGGAMPNLSNGAKVYRAHCAACHGAEGEGGHGGGPSLQNPPSIHAVMRMVRQGSENMPAFAGTLVEDSILDVSGHVIENLSR